VMLVSEGKIGRVKGLESSAADAFQLRSDIW